MTFGEFVNSEYNVDGWTLDFFLENAGGYVVVHHYGETLMDFGGGAVVDIDVIIENGSYNWL